MMGREEPPQPSLFYYGFNLERRVPENHPLRAVSRLIDFNFIDDLVEHHYGANGNESIPPSVILKLMFLLTFENVVSERKLMAMVPCRLDWLWFLGMDLDSTVPNHSVLSKARKRWGVRAFRGFFKSVLEQLIEAGLVDGSKIFCDGSLLDANASRKSLTDVELIDLDPAVDELERRLDEPDSEDEPAGTDPKPRKVRRSTTDPDAAVVTKPGAGSARARYKAHRAIDDLHGVITATLVTPGDVSEADKLVELIDQHEESTDTTVRVAVGDTQYGTNENLLACADRGITPHMPTIAATNKKTRQGRDLFEASEFSYEVESDTYRCPAGVTLKPWQDRPDRHAVRYAARTGCRSCSLKPRCTESPFRTITRHRREGELEILRAQTNNVNGKRDLRRRKSLMERSFAVGTRYGFKRTRWRRLWRAEIHEILVATVQNIEILIRQATRPFGRALEAARSTIIPAVRPELVASRP